MPRRRVSATCGIAVVAALALCGASGRTTVVHAATQSQLWPTYHADPTRSGEDTADGGFDGVTRAWTSAPLDGELYAQPILDGTTVVVATENDTLYGFDAAYGGMRWSTHVGTPVTQGLPCGNINPLGITGTPVLDPATHTIFALAERVPSGGGVEHVLVAVDTGDGHVIGERVMDPPGMDTVAQQQRGTLLIANGMVYVPYGGLYGDCSTYYGWVVGTAENLGGGISVWRSPGERSGIWEPAGVAADAGGNVYAATGNGISNPNCNGGNTVFKLDGGLNQVAAFADPNCVSDNNNDLDMGSAGVLLLPDGSLFVLGKQHTAYVVSQASMTERGSLGGLCESTGGDAYSAGRIYAPCVDGSGMLALNYDSGSGNLSVAWRGPTDSNGSPIVAGGYVWVTAVNGKKLYALNPGNGAVVMSWSVGAMHHFTSPSAGGGRVFLSDGTQLLAFSGQNPYFPGPPPVQGYWTAASDGGVFAYGTSGWYGSMGGHRLNSPVVGMAATPSGRGYWLVASDGGIFTFGDAGWYGSMGGHPLNAPVVGMAATPSGGYRMVATDGGIFDFGPGAGYFGSMGGTHLFAPMVGMAPAPGGGYWTVAADGGVFCFGPGAGYHGSTGGTRLNAPVAGIAPTASGAGYRMTAADGGIFDFGDALYYGSQGGQPLNAPMVAIAATG